MDTQLVLYDAPLELGRVSEVLDPEPQLNPRAMMTAIYHAVVTQGTAELTELEREAAWTMAFDEWLAEDPKSGAPRPQNTIRAYNRAWEDFKAFCPKKYWRVEPLDVKEWIADLRTRRISLVVERGTDPARVQGLIANGRRQAGQMGLSPRTVGQYISALSAFYAFAATVPVRAADGRALSLFDGMNPVKSQVVKRPQIRSFGVVLYLDAEQLNALLLQIEIEIGNHPAQGLRDYALFLCYISTGARNREVREWRWRDINVVGGKAFYAFDNKGRAGTKELPAEAWGAVEEFLRSTGRLASLQADDYIFQPLTDAALGLKDKDTGGRIFDPATWHRNRPLSAGTVNKLLRRYARLAGIAEAERLHVHCLRHSSYMLYRQAGVSLEDRSRLLGHASLATTTLYDHAISGQENVGWARTAPLLNLRKRSR